MYLRPSARKSPSCERSPAAPPYRQNLFPVFYGNRSKQLRSSARPREQLLDPRSNDVELRIRIDLAQQAARAVIVDQRPGLLVVDREALGDRLFVVVGPLHQARLVAALRAMRQRARGELWMLNTRPQLSQVRRPEMRLISFSSSTLKRIATSSGWPIASSMVPRPSACGMVRGKPSRMKPRAASGCARRSRTMRGWWRRRPACGIHDGLGALAELGALAHVRAQQVAGGDLRDAMAFDQPLGLRAPCRSRAHLGKRFALRCWVGDGAAPEKGGTLPGRFREGQTVRYPRDPGRR